MKILVLGFAALLLVACGNGGEQIIEEKVQIKVYGPGKVDADKAISVDELFNRFRAQNGEQDRHGQSPMEFTFTGELAEVCSTAGCWVKVDKGNGESFRVRFKDHFTIPTNTKKRTKAYIHGIAYMDTVSVELQQHFAGDDEGKSEEEVAKITEPLYEFNFEADAILFKTESRKVLKK